MAFLDACTADLSSGAEARKDARAEAWTQLCHAVLGSNNFLFRE